MSFWRRPNVNVVNNTTTRHADEIKVTENRAPTDESVRILDDMQAAAEKRVSERLTPENSMIDIKVTVFHEAATMHVKAVAFLKVNGNEIKADATINPHDIGVDHETLFNALRTAIAEAIADQVLWSSMPALQALRGGSWLNILGRR